MQCRINPIPQTLQFFDIFLRLANLFYHIVGHGPVIVGLSVSANEIVSFLVSLTAG
jgi:hypothetical protein